MSKPHIQFFQLQSFRWQLVEVDTLLVPPSIEEAEVLVTHLKTQVLQKARGIQIPSSGPCDLYLEASLSLSLSPS